MKIPIFCAFVAAFLAQASAPVARQAPDKRAGVGQTVEGDSATTQKLISQQEATPDAGVTPNGRSASQKANGIDQTVTVAKVPPVSISPGLTDKLAVIFSGVLVVIGGFGVFYAYRTLRAIQGQLAAIKDAGIQTDQIILNAEKLAQSAKASADAALLNAQGVVNAERAWITGSVGENSYRLFGNPTIIPAFELSLKNSGRTPGIVFRMAMKFEKRQTLDDLPPEPPLDISSIFEMGRTLIIRDDPAISLTAPIDGRERLTPEDWAAVRDRKLFLVVYGFIEYTNVIKPDFANPHKTSFCFAYAFANPVSHGFQACFTAPASYREVT